MLSVAELPVQIGFADAFIVREFIGVAPKLTANVLVKKLSQLFGGNLNAFTFSVVELFNTPVVNVMADPLPIIEDPVVVIPFERYN